MTTANVDEQGESPKSAASADAVVQDASPGDGECLWDIVESACASLGRNGKVIGILVIDPTSYEVTLRQGRATEVVVLKRGSDGEWAVDTRWLGIGS